MPPPCCHIPNAQNPNFPESLLPDASSFSQYVGGGNPQGDPVETNELTSALHLEMKLWAPNGLLPRRYRPNDAEANSWEAMRQRSRNTFDAVERQAIFSRICLDSVKRRCCLEDYDGWLLDAILNLRALGRQENRIPTPILPVTGGPTPTTLASIGHGQKLINMFVKYELCWQVAGVWRDGSHAHYSNLRILNLRQFLCALHAPIDSIVLKAIKELPIGAWLRRDGLMNPQGSLGQSSNGEFRPWSKLDCLRAYYGFQLMLRRVAMGTWPDGCACADSADDAIKKCGAWFNKKYGDGKNFMAGDWIAAACALPDDVVRKTLKTIGGNNDGRDDEHSNQAEYSAKNAPARAKRPGMPLSCGGDADCPCGVWSVLANDATYHAPLALPPMGGRAENLIFQFNPVRNELRVFRRDNRPNFVVNENDFKIICQRYHRGLAEGNLPRVAEMGGTGFFNNPRWPTPPLGQMNTPFVAPVIRHVLQRNPALTGLQPCC